MRAGFARAVDLLTVEDAGAATLLEEAGPWALTCLDFPHEHARWIRTNNLQERLNAKIKRRTRVVQVLPSPESLVRLAGAVLANQNDEWLAATNFMDVKGLAKGYESEPLPPLAEGAQERLLGLVEKAFVGKLGKAA